MDVSKTEDYLLRALAAAVVTAMGSPGNVVAITPIETIPPRAADEFVLVTGSGWRRGPRHGTSGGVHDVLFGAKVTVTRRLRAKRPDRLADAYVEATRSLNDMVDRVYNAVDFTYAVTTAANALILSAGGAGASQGFIHPLVFSRAGDVRELRASVYQAEEGGPPLAGLARDVWFDDARRMTTRS